MRILHTADWHLGKQLYGVSLLDEQAHALEQFHVAVRESSVDCVIIAGDIFDRAIASVEAVELFDDVVSRLSSDFNKPVIIISGNHDGPERLTLGSKVFAQSKFFFYGRLKKENAPLLLEDSFGPLAFVCIPYLDTPRARQVFQNQDISSQEQALIAAINCQTKSLSDKTRKVFVGHCFLAGGKTSESERTLSLSSSFTILPDVFAIFNYAALGHLHRAQSIATTRYSGSIVKYSASESNDNKSFTVVELNPNKALRLEEILISPKHDLRIIEGHFAELMESGSEQAPNDDYIIARLEDRTPILDAMSRLREHYPNILHIERPKLSFESIKSEINRDVFTQDEFTLFQSFSAQVSDLELSESELNYFKETLQSIQIKEQES